MKIASITFMCLYTENNLFGLAAHLRKNGYAFKPEEYYSDCIDCSGNPQINIGEDDYIYKIDAKAVPASENPYSSGPGAEPMFDGMITHIKAGRKYGKVLRVPRDKINNLTNQLEYLYLETLSEQLGKVIAEYTPPDKALDSKEIPLQELGGNTLIQNSL
jgi:hypothetical protein